jgi:hypothetical protein
MSPEPEIQHLVDQKNKIGKRRKENGSQTRDIEINRKERDLNLRKEKKEKRKKKR